MLLIISIALRYKEIAACTNKITARFTSTPEFADLLTQADGESAKKYLFKVLDPDKQLYETIKECGIALPGLDEIGPAFIKKFMKSYLSVMNKLDGAISIGTIGNFMYQTFKYWNDSRSITLCMYNGKLDVCGLPVVRTGAITDITGTTAICSGEIVSDGGSSLTRAGVLWQSKTAPNDWISINPVIGDFEGILSSLKRDTEYSVQAYADNFNG